MGGDHAAETGPPRGRSEDEAELDRRLVERMAGGDREALSALCAAADRGLVQLELGISFPLHTHVGEEVSLILAGRLLDRSTGHTHLPGRRGGRRDGNTSRRRVRRRHRVYLRGPRRERIEIGGVSVRPQKN